MLLSICCLGAAAVWRLSAVGDDVLLVASLQVLGDVTAARQVLHQGLQQHPSCRELWEGALWAEENTAGEHRQGTGLEAGAQQSGPPG